MKNQSLTISAWTAYLCGTLLFLVLMPVKAETSSRVEFNLEMSSIMSALKNNDCPKALQHINILEGLINELPESFIYYKGSCLLDIGQYLQARQTLGSYLIRSQLGARHYKDALDALNAAKEGFVETDSGLQYKILIEGDGGTPTAKDVVIAHYKGTLLDGTVFDSSYDRGEPSTFPVTAVIRGWIEVLQLMKEGSKWHIIVPADLAYGSSGAGRGTPIGPNETLTFDFELIAITH